MATPSASARDLWAKAVSSVDPKVINNLASASTNMLDVVTAALRTAENKRKDCAKKLMRIPRHGKEDIIVSDVLKKIVTYIDRFKAVGDNIIQHDPGHAALPWAAICFILQAAVNYTQAEQDILDGIELVTRLLAYFREVEKLYVGPDMLSELQDSLVSSYAAILEILADAVEILSRSRLRKIVRAPFRLPNKEKVQRLLEREQDVLRFKGMTDGKWSKMSYERTMDLSANTEKAVHNSKYVAVLDWLSKVNHRDHHEGLRRLRTSGTAAWLLRCPEYVSWQQQSTCSILLVHGIPGCGKTILCSAIVDEGLKSSVPSTNRAPLAFFYCSAAASEPDRRNANSVLRSLVRQLTTAASQRPSIHSAVLAVYDKKLEDAEALGFNITPLQAQECENLILELLEDNPATIVVDAIDELDDHEELLSHLETIWARSRNVVKIFITSRDGHSGLPTARRIRVTAKDNHLDVQKFVEEQIEKLMARRRVSPDMKDQLVTTLVSGAGEMFQWAKLQLSQFEHSTPLLIEQDICSKLSEVAVSTLEGLHGSIHDKILQSGDVARRVAVQSFSWLLYAQEPMTMDAFLTIMAGAAGWQKPDQDDLLGICHGFIYIDYQSSVVRFVHDSVRMFLRSRTHYD